MNIPITTESCIGQCWFRLNFQFTGNIGDAIQVKLLHEKVELFRKDNNAGENRRQQEKRKMKCQMD